jgi:alcohol dehydrogenase (cytochrome c)
MKLFFTRSLTALVLLSLAGSLGVWWFADSPSLQWRLEVIRLKMLGAVPGESWSQIMQRLRPETLDGIAGIPRGTEDLQVVSVLTSQRSLQAGAQLFQSRCAHCHMEGGSDMGPDLADASSRTRFSDSAVYWTLSTGIAGSMPRFQGTVTEVLELTAYVSSLVKATTETEGRTVAAKSACPTCQSVEVSYEELLDAARHPDQWLTYSGSYTGQHFSSLQQINHQTIDGLRPRWIHQMRSLQAVESNLLVVDGVMFLTGPANGVIALDAGTGEPLWAFRRPILDDIQLCCGAVNRGVAILGKRVYHATLDGHLIALDAASGRPVWDVQVADPAAGYSLTGAPLAVKDKIILGVGGGDTGARGFVDAYDAETGKRVWRFETIPGPGEKGHETWENDAWETGGGATWMTGSFDPDLNLLYWGVGNPAPGFDGEYRPGDNLYTCSVIALDPDTGQLKWHYQFTPHDTNDWDAATVPVLADLEYGGEIRKLMLSANRNCFYYILDRETGQFLQATQYCEQNWNDGFTPEGRPIRRPKTHPTTEGVLIRPSSWGGANWWGPAFSPRTGLYYVTFQHRDHMLWQSPAELNLQHMFKGGGWDRRVPGSPAYTGVRAIKAATGEVVWQKIFGDQTPGMAGILVTAGDLVFTASGSGVLFALDARTGEDIWEMRLGGRVAMGPMTYLHEGKQQLALISAGSLFVLDLAGQPERPGAAPRQSGTGRLTLSTDRSTTAE